MEHYPLILDGAESGTVAVFGEGGWTWFEARCAAVPGIVRISVYGEGREGYLGVLAPKGEELTLRRRFSRSEMRAFPQRIEYAARSGQPCAKAPEPEAETLSEPAPEPQAEQSALPERGDVPPAPEPMQEAAPQEPEPEAAPPEPGQEAAPPALEDVYWYASPDGALVCFDGEQNLIALPAGDVRIPSGPGGWPRTIEGRDYVVYRTKDGRLVR